MGVFNEKLWLITGYILDDKEQKVFMNLLNKLRRKKGSELIMPSAEIVVNGRIRILIGFSGSKVGWGRQEMSEDFAREILSKIKSLKKDYFFDVYHINHGEQTDDKVLFNHYKLEKDAKSGVKE